MKSDILFVYYDVGSIWLQLSFLAGLNVGIVQQLWTFVCYWISLLLFTLFT